MIAVIGLIMFAVSSYLALSKKMHLMVPFVVVPVIAGLFCGFSLPEVLNFAAEGVTGTFNSVLLCIFAVLYFSVLSETGMFDIMVNRLVGITRGNIYIVMVVIGPCGFHRPSGRRLQYHIPDRNSGSGPAL